MSGDGHGQRPSFCNSSGRLELNPLSSESQRQTAIPNKHQASVIGHRTLASARLLKNQSAAGMGGRERNAGEWPGLLHGDHTLELCFAQSARRARCFLEPAVKTAS
uniref:Uncharacterized protein n=1 Tax=Coccidioides posadasii RMSCC 3488 TaxID=454284 RepID=A0A0J6FLH1_COCPO|nr:hypothetical protein CPAG_06028 [Coccidioides posadasii RMSCC 3488]